MVSGAFINSWTGHGYTEIPWADALQFWTQELSEIFSTLAWRFLFKLASNAN